MKLAVLVVVWAAPVRAQAPLSAEMWRVATATLAAPAALQGGPTGAFWNPAPQVSTGSTRVGIQILQTPDALALSGILAGISHQANGAVLVGAILGRVEVSDLVRTTASPLSELGSIPVYEQLAGVHVGVRLGALSAGGALRGHESRFDAIRSTGATVDVGFRFAPSERMIIAGATHFFPVTFRADNTTDYYGALEYRTAEISLWGYGTKVTTRYGASYRDPHGLEHSFGGGLLIADLLTVDGAVTREVAFGDAAWRPALQIGLGLGRYSIAAARSNGLNGLGALYRFALDVVLQ
ncbi:MAG: hypothetical protein IID05_10010 [Gemmatimonadetes bacterium]|nr:hypothetical protein [Gemmatimonadota bacterium]